VISPRTMAKEAAQTSKKRRFRSASSRPAKRTRETDWILHRTVAGPKEKWGGRSSGDRRVSMSVVTNETLRQATEEVVWLNELGSESDGGNHSRRPHRYNQLEKHEVIAGKAGLVSIQI